MADESAGRKIWRVLYPVIALFVFYFAVIYGALFIFSSTPEQGGGTDAAMGRYFPVITSVALAAVIIVEFIFYKNDYVAEDRTFFKKPLNIILIAVLGAAASHGFSLLISLLNLGNVAGDYSAVENEIFGAGVIFTILRALILAPVAEELVFRGLVFRRMKEYTSFWPAAIVSAIFFGIYHLNLEQGIYAFIFGLILAAVYNRFNNIFAPILLHFFANLLSVILVYANAEYPSQTIIIIVMAACIIVSAFTIFKLLRV